MGIFYNIIKCYLQSLLTAETEKMFAVINTLIIVLSNLVIKGSFIQ